MTAMAAGGGARRAEHRRRLTGRSATVLLVGLSLSLLSSAPALAATQRGHVFNFSFGAPGKGEGQFFTPSGVAVNSSSGAVYVADTNNSRVEEFKPVRNQQGALIGEQYVTQFSVPFPKAIAVDNSTNASDPSKGDVYVTGSSSREGKETEPEEAHLIYKFSSEGGAIAKITTFSTTEKGSREKLEGLEGVAVDSSGTLFAYEQNALIYKFDDAAVNLGESSQATALAANSGQSGFALDSEGKAYVGALGNAAAAASEEATASEERPLQDLVAQIGKVFHEETGSSIAWIAKLEGSTGRLLLPELDFEDATAVAVNPEEEPSNGVSERNDVYLLNRGTTLAGEQVSTVAAFGPDGTPIQRFSAPGLKNGEGIAVDAHTGAVYVVDAASSTVDVFGLEQAGRPTVEGLSACTFASGAESGCPESLNATTLKASVNPAGADTHYYFEYGTASCAGVPSPCTKTAATDVGGGFGARGASAELQNLPPGTYHYRVVAEDSFGSARSAEQTFTILVTASGLPDGRAWEMVSPANKDGAEPEPLTKEGGVIQASESGEAITYVADGPIPAGYEPEGNRNPEYTQVLSTRGPDGWISRDIATPNSTGSGVETAEPPEYQFFSRSLSLGLATPGGTTPGTLALPPLSPPLTPGEVQEKTIYLRDNVPVAPEASEASSYEQAKHNGELMQPANAGFLALVTRANAPGGAVFGGEAKKGLEFYGATPDLSHVVFATTKEASGLYEWGAGETLLQPVSVLPHESQVLSSALATLGGSGGRNVRHAISNDGSRVFWEQSIKSRHHLYVRDTQTHETLAIDVPQPGASGAGPEEPVFQTASASGNRVFFTDEQRLTPDAGAVAGAPDLYVFELGEGSTLSGTLTDLTPQAGADVLALPAGGGVLGASEDGSYVYFVANGALAPGASRGFCTHHEQAWPRGLTCNLYVRHYDGTAWTPTTLVAPLSFEDMPDWGGSGTVGDLSYTTSRVSPNGRYLAFMSDRSLTGYDNEDVTSKKKGERLDEEVFEYDAQTGDLVCASCNPSGERPAGVFDSGLSAGEGIGLVIDRVKVWSPHKESTPDSWLAGSLPGWTKEDLIRAFGQSRYLSDEGRLFFNSPDHLVPAATGVKAKVYEYEPGGVGGCQGGGGCVGLISSGTSEHEAAFLEASASGDDAFFLTASPLIPQDVDSNFDVYDARVCGEACPPPPSGEKQACEGEECQPSESASHLPGAASTTSSGSGNLVQQLHVLPAKEAAEPKSTPKPLTRAQKLANALKACRKDKNKRKRAVCEAQARKKYGPVKHAAAKKASAKGKR